LERQAFVESKEAPDVKGRPSTIQPRIDREGFMDRMILDPALSAQLSAAPLPVEICDAGGQLLGIFVPSKEDYANVAPPISEEELIRRESTSGGRTWAEIRSDLEKKYGPAGA
jgi:hypothetical protein